MRKTLERLVRALALMSLAPALAGCEYFVYSPRLPEAPSGEDGTAAEAVAPEPSEASRALSAYYQRIEADLLSQGLLRRDGGGPEAPFGPRDLAQNFARIALYDEYTVANGRLIARPKAATLRRWEGPLRINVEFGETVPYAQRRKDTRDIRAYAARLSRLTGRPIQFGVPNPNFHILVLNEDERLTYGPRIAAQVPGITHAAMNSILDMPRSTFCQVHAFSDSGTSSAFSAAVMVVRGEHPDLMRLSCFHEELAQGMGLANDSPTARPSIFNDDEEFALLTTQDEMLLRILYDPRLKVGMTEAEAMPMVQAIAAEYFDGTG